MQVDLSNKVALVTGAAQGIGEAIADTLATNGARVVYTDIKVALAEDAAAKHPGCIAREMDVREKTQVNDVLNETAQSLGSLDILVNNAGVNTLQHRVTIDEFPVEEWDRIVDVDLRGLYLVSQVGSRIMRRQGSGKIINIASIAGLVPLRLQCAFVAAKGAVVNLTKGMALELGEAGINVNGIAPGSTLTQGTRDLFYSAEGKFSDSAQRMLDHVPLGRPAQCEEIAHAALFLAAPESSYIHGHILTVDGGWTVGYARDF